MQTQRLPSLFPSSPVPVTITSPSTEPSTIPRRLKTTTFHVLADIPLSAHDLIQHTHNFSVLISFRQSTRVDIPPGNPPSTFRTTHCVDFGLASCNSAPWLVYCKSKVRRRPASGRFRVKCPRQCPFTPPSGPPNLMELSSATTADLNLNLEFCPGHSVVTTYSSYLEPPATSSIRSLLLTRLRFVATTSFHSLNNHSSRPSVQPSNQRSPFDRPPAAMSLL